MGIYKKVEVDIIQEDYCDNRISEHNTCNGVYFIVLNVNDSKYYYCIECDLDELKNKILNNV